jgi:hypothetical protein
MFQRSFTEGDGWDEELLLEAVEDTPPLRASIHQYFLQVVLTACVVVV